LKIDAGEYWNPTGIVAKAGHKYRIAVAPNSIWFDWGVPSGPGGYMRWYLAPFLPLLRVRHAVNGSARFFSLILTIGKSTEYAFVINHDCTIEAPDEGEIMLFANDVPWAYGNNKGSIEISLTPDDSI